MSDEQRLLADLLNLTMKQQWEELVKRYKENTSAHRMKLTKSDDTAFHIAISSYNSKSPSATHDICTKEMFSLMKVTDLLDDVLRIQNARGDTPLHLAAAVGWEALCKLIASEDPKLIEIRNDNGETPLFIAAHHRNHMTFLSLHSIYNDGKDKADESLCRRKDGNTILHSAIYGEYFRSAYFILEHYKNLVNYVNVDGETPLHVLAKKPNLFESSFQLGFYESIIYQCVIVDDDDLKKQHKHDQRPIKIHESTHADIFPENYRTCVGIFLLLWNPIYRSYKGSLSRSRFSTDVEDQPYVEHGVPIYESFLAGCSRSKKQNAIPSDENGENQTKGAEVKSKRYSSYPPNYTTCISIFKFVTKVILVVLGIGFLKVRKIQAKKVRHSQAVQIMNKMIESLTSDNYDWNGKRQRPEALISIPDSPPDGEEQVGQYSCDTPLLVAARMGIPEMVYSILNAVPLAIQDQESDGKNVVMVAAENRKINVFHCLVRMIDVPNYVFDHLDNQGNTILHIAASLGRHISGSVSDAALQMQWEIKWYKHVKKSVPPRCRNHHNAEGEIPWKIFRRTHSSLVKSGNEWLTKTSEFCTAVAAVIATVAFATASTVPGGLDQTKGYPILKDQTAFKIYSIASLIALCLSIAALVSFFAIMISRFKESDFERDLPIKLLMGLTCLIFAIAAMLVSFCAGHSFILVENLRVAALLIYVAATIIMAYFAMAKLPLYFDILCVSCRNVPVRGYKVFRH